jgi:hypothetical protein
MGPEVGRTGMAGEADNQAELLKQKIKQCLESIPDHQAMQFQHPPDRPARVGRGARMCLIWRRLVALVSIVAALAMPTQASPGDKGTIVARSFRIGDVIPIGSWTCCGGGISVDVAVSRVAEGKFFYIPRIVLTSPDGGPPEYLLFDLEGFEELLVLAEEVETVEPDADGAGQKLVGETSTMLPVMYDGLLRTVIVGRTGGERPLGMIISMDPETKSIVLGATWHLSPPDGHYGWPDVIRLLRRVRPAVKAYHALKVRN